MVGQLQGRCRRPTYVLTQKVLALPLFDLYPPADDRQLDPIIMNQNDGRDQNIADRGGVINVQNGPTVESVLQNLAIHAAFSALHNSEARGPRTGVHEGTREEFIGKLDEWIQDPAESGRVYWIRGGAGVGKSAIAQTICEKYAGNLLAASYFFSRNDDLRNTMDHFIPTIAYQLAKSHGVHSPLASKISEVFSSDPSIMHIDWEEQFSRLIREPCNSVEAEFSTRSTPRLIVIDGLDECMDRDPQTNEIDRKPGKREGQRRLLAMIRNTTSTQPPLPLHFLIFSRPEHTISTSFRSHPFNPALEEFDMRELRAQADADIELYLRGEFARFPELHPYACLEKSWPGKDAIQKLTLNADGHFIYVVTAMKYIAGDNPDLLLPQERLAVVLRTSETSLYPDLSTLDQLFQHILQPFIGFHTKQILLPILQLIISLHRDANTGGTSPTFIAENGLRCRSRDAIAKLLKLDCRQVSAILSRLHSVLYVPDDEHRDNVSVLHASFSDFLTDQHRSLHFYVEPLRERAYFGMLSQCLLPVLNDMTRRHNAGERMVAGMTTFELYSLDVWLFVGAVFGAVKYTSGMPHDDYVPTEELIDAINQFNVYHYINMLVDRDYMGQAYTTFSHLITLDYFENMDAWTSLLLENVPCVRELYLKCSESTGSVSGSSTPYASRFRAELNPFIDRHRSLFEDGWLAMVPRTSTPDTLSHLALLIATVCGPLRSGSGYDKLYLKFFVFVEDSDSSGSPIPLKNFPRDMDLEVVPEGSDVWFIDCEEGKIFVDALQTLGRNTSYERDDISDSITRRFTGLDDWNDKLSNLLSRYHPGCHFREENALVVDLNPVKVIHLVKLETFIY
ncbi:hypothetical protein V5O48_005161 [Marasmius crinis-equi]|uniref:NACHT domain-containing protein n=1 Tax=Marasmius crinis-equi TaxID=585013 RepID=A0ABR3FNI1_9AGAR